MAKDILDISPVVGNHQLVLENPPSGFDVYSRRIKSDGGEYGKGYPGYFAGG